MSLTLFSNSLMGKYVLVRSYDLCEDPPLRVEYLYDHNAPIYDYLHTSDRKKIKVVCLSTGTYNILYDSHVFNLHVYRVQTGTQLLVNKEGDIIYQIDITMSETHPIPPSPPPQQETRTVQEILVDFVDHCKTHVEAKMKNYCRDAGKTIKKFIFDTCDHGYWSVLNITNKRPLESIFLPTEVKETLLSKILHFASDQGREEYGRFNVPYKMNVLFHGLPGSGKTSCIHAIASSIDSDIGIIHFGKAMDDTMLTRAVNLMSNLDKCRVLVLEDIDSLFNDDRKAHDTLKNAVTMSGLLNCLDGLSRNEGIIVFMTTNRKDVLEDAAFLRSSRVDIDLEFTDASHDQMRQMLDYYFPEHMKNATPTAVEDLIASFRTKTCTTAVLQQYFFENRNCDNILSLRTFKAYCDSIKNKNKESKTGNTLYT